MTKEDFNNRLNYLNSLDNSDIERNIKQLISEINEDEGIDSLSESDWEEFFNSDVIIDKDLSHILHSIHHEIENDKKKITTISLSKRIIKSYMKVAAVLMIPILAMSSYFYTISKKQYAINSVIEVKAPDNSRVKCILPDSSVVWINSGSSVSYNYNFVDNRQIKLKGKAYFEVTHTNNDAKFSVSFKNGNVDVLGTKFSISSNRNGNFNVVLKEGKVKASIIKEGKNKKEIILKPNQMLVSTKDKSIIKKVNAKNITAWIDGKLIFRNTPLKYVFSRISDLYDVNIVVEDEELYKLTYWGTFKDEKLEEILKLMSLNLPMEYEIKQRRLLKNKTFTRKKVLIQLKKQ